MVDDPFGEAKKLIGDGRPGEAAALLEQIHRQGRGGLLLEITRVRALIAAGDPEAAAALAREAARLHPNVAVAALSLGEAMLAVGRLPTAISECQRALRLDPELDAARFALGTAWLEAGEAEKAAEAFDALAEEFEPAEVAKKRDEISAMMGRPRSDPRYVRHLFDQFSSDYDRRMLNELGYAAPIILRDLAELVGLTRRGKLSVLDLGCGTGLAGVTFRDIAARLDGIDLSPAMIGKARERGIYDALRVADIEAAMAETEQPYALILAADTLVYLGDLATLFRNAFGALAPGGAFLFTVERKDGEGFELGPKRRWRHSESYLRIGAEVAGFEVAGFLACEPRSEAGNPVEGFAVALERK